MLDVILLLLAVGIAVYVWLTWNYDYWLKQGVPYVKPTLIFGTTKEYTTSRQNIGVVLKKYYEVFIKSLSDYKKSYLLQKVSYINSGKKAKFSEFYSEIGGILGAMQQYDEPAVGLFKMRQPQLMIRDVDLVKTILIKEFSSFHDNDFSIDEKIDPILGNNPFASKGEKWKKLRSLHTQQHTSGKIKHMYSFMNNVNKDMIKFLDEKQGDKIDSKYFCGQYTTDVVGSCIYGLRTNSFVDPDAKFRQISAQIFEPGLKTNLVFILASVAPKLANALNLKMISDEVANFFHGIVRDVRDHRLKNNIVQNDFLGSLIEENKKNNPIVDSLEKITAHSLTFFFDGYETSSILMAFSLYILSIYQDIQQKLRDELNSAENLEYDTVHSLAYLDAVIYETLRMYPPGPWLGRECCKDTEVEFKGKKYIFKKGMSVVIPVLGIQMDPKNFQSPEVFNPERFYKQPPSPCLLSFGMGPRACIGQRFALAQVKAGLANIITNFRILPALENAKLPEINPNSILLIPKDPMWIKFEKIKQ